MLDKKYPNRNFELEVSTDKEIRLLAEKRFGIHPHSFGGQRDGFVEGYKQAQTDQKLKVRQLQDVIGVIKGEIELTDNPQELPDRIVIKSIKSLLEKIPEVSK